jgi:phytoene dehydrogenase-like protein
MGAPGRLAALEILKDGKVPRDVRRTPLLSGRMAETRDIVIVGGGHNGLVTAFYLAKAGFKPLVLERRAQVGGAAITEELHPGFRCSTLAHSRARCAPTSYATCNSSARPEADDARRQHCFAASRWPRARSLFRRKKAAQEIAQWSQKDAAAYGDFGAALGKIGKVIGEALALTPPNIDNPSAAAISGACCKTGRSIRNLGKKDLYRVLRWGPMAVADLVAEFFDTEPLRATIAARGIFGTFLGPWSAGSALSFLLRAAADRFPIPPAGRIVQFPAGGAGAITASDGCGGAKKRARNSHRTRRSQKFA